MSIKGKVLTYQDPFHCGYPARAEKDGTLTTE